MQIINIVLKETDKIRPYFFDFIDWPIMLKNLYKRLKAWKYTKKRFDYTKSTGKLKKILGKAGDISVSTTLRMATS